MEINKNYKQQHKPIITDKSKYHQGYYIPEHPEKWLTKENIFRSSYEFVFMRWCDQNPAVLKVASEPIGIKYLDPTGNLEYCMKHNLDPNNPQNWKVRTYYTDFWIEIADETKPDLVHYICKYGYRISEEDGQMKVLRIGFIEYGKESTDNMA